MSPWENVTAALDAACRDGRHLAVWLRDDDAVAVTPALERLAAIVQQVGLPVLLAVIPEPADSALAAWVAARPDFVPCQHGWAHKNHAPAGARAVELGGRAPELVLAELEQGRRRLQALFGCGLCDILVPPWNRIDPELIPYLPALGFAGLSTFGPVAPDHNLLRINADLDIIDWRRGRSGRPAEDLAKRLVELIGEAATTGRAIGLLTHHLVHDSRAWEGLEAMLACLASHPGVVLTTAAPAATLM